MTTEHSTVHADIQDATGIPSSRQLSSRAERVDCAVIIVTYNSARDIISLLESLPAAAAGLTLRIVIVDNGSTDGTVDLIHGRADVTYVETGTNLGYAGGINVGRANAGTYRSLLVLNPDVVLEPDAIYKLADRLDDPLTGIVAPMLLDLGGQRFPSLRRFPTLTRAIGDGLLGSRFSWRPGWLSEMIWNEAEYSYRHRVDWATGAALLISAACDRAVGHWEEQYFLYSEETDYAIRAHAAGFRIEYLPTARVFHRGGGSGEASDLIALMATSRVRYIEKHGRWPRLYRITLIIAELLRSGDPGHRAALRALLRRSAWPALIANLKNTSAHGPRHESGQQPVKVSSSHAIATPVHDDSRVP